MSQPKTGKKLYLILFALLSVSETHTVIYLNSIQVTGTDNKDMTWRHMLKVLQYTGGHDLFSIGRRRSPAVSTADIPLVSQGAFFQHIHASEPEHWPAYDLVIRAIVKIFKRELLVEINYNCIRTVDKWNNISFPSPIIVRPNLSLFWVTYNIIIIF